jgi:hypothetical protein
MGNTFFLKYFSMKSSTTIMKTDSKNNVLLHNIFYQIFIALLYALHGVFGNAICTNILSCENNAFKMQNCFYLIIWTSVCVRA